MKPAEPPSKPPITFTANAGSVSFQLPYVPQVFYVVHETLNPYASSYPIEIFDEAILREVGRKWTEQLVEAANSKRNRK